MTLDLYGHLFPDQLDQVADRLDAAARAVVYPSQHHPDIGGLEETKGTGQARWVTRWKPALNAFAVTFADRTPNPQNL